MSPTVSTTMRRDIAQREERSDDLAGRGDPGGFAARGEGSRDPSPGRLAEPTKERP